jgi:hypothetical protein
MASSLVESYSNQVTGIATYHSSTISKTTTLAGDSDVVSDTQDVGNSSETITLGEISVSGAECVAIKNLDSTNSVSLGFNNPVVAGTETVTIPPGRVAVLPRPSGQLYGISSSGTVKIQKWAVEQ